MTFLHHDFFDNGTILFFQYFPDDSYFVIYHIFESTQLLILQLFLIHQNNVNYICKTIYISVISSEMQTNDQRCNFIQRGAGEIGQDLSFKMILLNWTELFLILIQSLGMKFVILGVLLLFTAVHSCDVCYSENQNSNCRKDEVGLDSYTLHMTVHPHLDAFWIFDFDSYFSPKPNQGDVQGYFASNRFTSVKDIFTIAKDNLWQSKKIRENVSNKTQRAHRSFVNSEMGFFKHWYNQQNAEEKNKVKELLKTKYWEILGGGYVQQDEGCAYYDDIIENFELGLHFLKEQFNYYPKVAVAADSFGHSQGTLAILAHLGIEGYFVQRSDQHILLQNKTEFIWRAQSANGKVYGALPTHIRWAIHGFQDQFLGSNVNQEFCQSKEPFIRNLRTQNQFLKRILKSTHIMRYFGHDFQKFDNYSYSVIEGMMKKFSMEKCNKVVALYGNPTEYFLALMGEVYGKKVKPVVTRSQDIFPIWDYDSGLYWTGYFTTDAYHKKDYRDLGRFLHGIRKIFANVYLQQPQSDKNKKSYQLLQEAAEQVSYLQHHDGISGTSKYTVMDKLQKQNEDLTSKMSKQILTDIFADQFPKGTNSPIFECHLGKNCKIPQTNKGDVYLKIINTDGSPVRDPIIVEVPMGHQYMPDCPYELNCFCYQETCPCKLYLYKLIYTFTSIRLKKVEQLIDPKVNRLTAFTPTQQYYYSATHFTITHKDKKYSLGYKRVTARGTPRRYDHLSRYGQLAGRSFNIRPGKYALGNDPSTAIDFSEIKRVSQLESQRMMFFVIEWKRYQMKTFISIPKDRLTQWTVDTITATEGYYLSDLYFEVITPVNNKNQFVTDSNGWVTVKRELFKHEDYSAFFCQEKYDDLDGNSYPATSFAFLEDQSDKVSVNLDRPQGVVAYRPGTLWINFDRLSEDDGKWVYESALRSQYQKYTHVVTVQNKDYNERKIQRQYDQPLFIQGNTVSPSQRIEDTDVDIEKRNQWNRLSNLDDLKFMIRPFNDSTTILRIHNLNDSDSVSVGLFAGKVSPLLTTYYSRTVTFEEITEASLGGNMPYSKFLNDKWNWNNVVNLSFENQIFNKEFKENITLRPLELRTFILKNMKFAEKCLQIKELKYNQQGINYTIDVNKPMPVRDQLSIEIEKEVIYYNQFLDHCEVKSPILDQNNVTSVKSEQNIKNDQIFKPNIVTNTPVISHNDAEAPLTDLNHAQGSLSSTEMTAQMGQDSSNPVFGGISVSMEQIRSKVKNRNILTPIQKETLFTWLQTQIRTKKKGKTG